VVIAHDLDDATIYARTVAIGAELVVSCLTARTWSVIKAESTCAPPAFATWSLREFPRPPWPDRASRRAVVHDCLTWG
jgi:hypothetical protein